MEILVEGLVNVATEKHLVGFRTKLEPGQHRKNLETLRDFLRINAEALKAASSFNMRSFLNGTDSPFCDSLKYQCGTIACAIGWTPVATGYCSLKGNNAISWKTYCNVVFGIDFYSSEAQWMFDLEWESFDNTPEGAAERIDCYLRHGGVPYEWCHKRYLGNKYDSYYTEEPTGPTED